MVLGDRQWAFRRRLVPSPVRWRRGLGLVPGLSVISRYDTRPEALCAVLAMRAPRGSVVVGIDTDTAVVGRDGSWQVHGRSRVTVWRGRHRERFRPGDAFRL
jgi:cyanophycinase-like exopeptidase